MDAFSRLLAFIGQSLGKGLGQVGQSELEQKQRLEALEAQRKANISGQLLQTFTQLLQTQGIQEVESGGIDVIKQAVTDLALGKIDSPAVQGAIEVFPKVAASANKLSVYKELATRDIDALSRIIVNTDPREAQSLLGAIGLRGLYEGLKARGEILTQADKLGLKLTEEQIESLAAQRRALLAELEPKIEKLKAEALLTIEQAKTLREKLPVELTILQLQAKKLGIDIAKGEKELARFDQILDLSIEKLASEVGLTKEQANLLREQIRTEVLRQGQIEAQTELTKADIELKRMQAKEIADTLGPRIQEMMARTEFYKAQANAILQRLPLELEGLLLDIKKKGIELERLPDLLDAELAERFSKIGLTEAQTGLTKQQIDFIKEQTKTEILEQLRTEAETEKIKAETEETRARQKWVETQTKVLIDEFRLKLEEWKEKWLEDKLDRFFKYGITDVDFIKSTLTSEFSPLKLSEEQADLMARRISGEIARAVTARNLQLTDAVSKTAKELIAAAAALENPEKAREFMMSLLPEGVSEEVRKAYGYLAYKVTATAMVSKIQEETDTLLKQPPPPKEREGNVLRPLYERAKKAFGEAYANGLVSQIKAYWAFQREAQQVKLESETAEIRQKEATALYNKAMAATLPDKLRLEKDDLELKREQVAQGWARLRLEELEAMARASNNQNLIDFVNKFATSAKNVGAIAKNMLVQHLQNLGHAKCAGMVSGADPENLASMIVGIGGECATIIKDVLNNKNDPVAAAFNRAVEMQAATIESIASTLGVSSQSRTSTPGTTQPGGTTPTTPGAGGRPFGTTTPGGAPSGTAAPPAGDFVSGVRTKFNTLKQFGVQIPNDPKLAGAMVFVYGTESGPWYNPFQVTEGAGVPMKEITIEEGGQKNRVKVPVGPDKGFQAVIDADKSGTRKKALAIDSAIAFGVSWIFPNEAPKPGMLAKYIREDFRNRNPGLFRRAENFKSRTGAVDMVSVAAAYADMSLEKLGAPIRYTEAYTGLLRLLVEHDLDMLRAKNPLPPEKAKERYLNLVRSNNELLSRLLEAVRRKSPDLTREQAFQKALEMAESLYDATRLSNIGNLVLGGGR
jgi:hypothetical protein